MFSINARNHIEREMKIVLASIESKLSEKIIVDYRGNLIQLIEELVVFSKMGEKAAYSGQSGQ